MKHPEHRFPAPCPFPAPLLLALALVAWFAAGQAAWAPSAHAQGSGTTYHAPWDTTGSAAESLRVQNARADSLAKLANPFEPVRRDTSGAPFHYTTGYEINRFLSNWTQTLNVDSRWRGLHIDNATNINFNEDNQQHKRSAQRQERLRLGFVGPSGLTAGMALDVGRNNDGPVIGGRLHPTSDFNTNSARLTLGDSLYLTRTNRFAFSLEGGRTGRDENTSVRRNSSGSELLQKAAWSYYPSGPFQFQFNANNSSVHSSSEGFQPALGPLGRDTTLFTDNHNHDLNLAAQSRFSVPWRALQINVNGTYVNSRLQQPTPGADQRLGLETLQQRTDNVDATTSMNLLNQLSMSATAHADRNFVLSDVDSSRNYDTRSRNGSMTFNYTGPRIATISATLGDRFSTNDYRNRLSGSLQNVSEHNLSGNLQRNLGRFALALNLSARLSATRYPDTIAARQNQDYLNRRIGGSLNYTPPNLPVTLNFQASEVMNHYVYLDASQSSRSNIDRLYSVEYDVAYHRGNSFTISEVYIVSADAGVSDFDTIPGLIANNRYTKSTNYITTIREAVMPRITLDVSHNLRLTRSGSFDRDPVSGLRLFGESSDGMTNDLSVRASYHLSDWFSLFAEDHAQVIHNDNIVAGGAKAPSSRQRILEFNAGAEISYDFAKRAKLTGSFSRSSRNDIYTTFPNGAVPVTQNTPLDYFLISANFDLRF